jgi:hypothetical protein
MAFTVQIPSSLPCPGDDIFSLPTKEDLVNALNKIAQIPSQLKVEMAKLGSEITAEVKAQIEDIIKTIEALMDRLQSLLSPWWQKQSVRNWQKEINDAITELIQEFHIYIPTKIAELITKIIPINLNVTILGISINIVKLFTAAEQTKIKAQIAANVDKFFALIPASLRGFDGKFGVICNDWKAKMTWQYIKTEIQAFLTGGIHAVFGKLIKKFDVIWDALGLPSLISLFTMPDVGALVDAAIKSFVSQRDKLMKKLQDAKDFDVREKLKSELSAINTKITDAIEKLSVFGFNISAIIGGKIDTTVNCLEEKVVEMKMALQDFCQNWQKKLLFEWVNIVKKFFSAIGLGKIFSFLTFTWCNFLKLLGFPTSLGISIPAISGVMSTTTKVYPQKVIIPAASLADDSGIMFETSDGITLVYSIIGTGTLMVFVDGTELTEGVDYTVNSITGGKEVVFNTAPAENTDISLIFV